MNNRQTLVQYPLWRRFVKGEENPGPTPVIMSTMATIKPQQKLIDRRVFFIDQVRCVFARKVWSIKNDWNGPWDQPLKKHLDIVQDQDSMTLKQWIELLRYWDTSFDMTYRRKSKDELLMDAMQNWVSPSENLVELEEFHRLLKKFTQAFHVAASITKRHKHFTKKQLKFWQRPRSMKVIIRDLELFLQAHEDLYEKQVGLKKGLYYLGWDADANNGEGGYLFEHHVIWRDMYYLMNPAPTEAGRKACIRCMDQERIESRWINRERLRDHMARPMSRHRAPNFRGANPFPRR